MIKSDRDFLYILLIICVVFYFLFYTEKIEDNYAIYEKRIENLENSLDSLVDLNTELDNEVRKYQLRSDSLQTVLVSLNKDIVKIRKDAQDRINSIDTIGHEQLLQFFTDRYN